MTEQNATPTPNIYWVRPGHLIAGPYPAPQKKTTDRLKWLLDAGVTFFVDLTEAGELPSYLSLLPEGVQHKRMPIRDWSVPTSEHMTAILDTIDSAIDSGKIVYVHCWGGIGRTGTTVGCYMVRHGMEGQAALDEIIRLRGGQRNSPETDEQRQMVLKWQKGS